MESTSHISVVFCYKSCPLITSSVGVGGGGVIKIVTLDDMGEGGTMRTLGTIFIVTFHRCVLAFVGFCLKSIANEFLGQMGLGNAKNKGAQGCPPYEMAP